MSSPCTLVVSNSDPSPKRKGGSGHPGGLKGGPGTILVLLLQYILVAMSVPPIQLQFLFLGC